MWIVSKRYTLWRTSIIVLIGVICIYFAAIFVLNTSYVDQKVAQKIKGQTGQEVIYDSLHLTLGGYLEFRNVRVVGMSCSIELLRISFHLSQLFQRELVIKRLELIRPSCEIELDEIIRALQQKRRVIKDAKTDLAMREKRSRPVVPIKEHITVAQVDQPSDRQPPRDYSVERLSDKSTQKRKSREVPVLVVQDASVTLRSKIRGLNHLKLSSVYFSNNESSDDLEKGELSLGMLELGDRMIELQSTFPVSIQEKTLSVPKTKRSIFGGELQCQFELRIDRGMPCRVDIQFEHDREFRFTDERIPYFALSLGSSCLSLKGNGRLLNLATVRGDLDLKLGNICLEFLGRESQCFDEFSAQLVLSNFTVNIPKVDLENEEMRVLGQGQWNGQAGDLGVLRIVLSPSWREKAETLDQGIILGGNLSAFEPLGTNDRFFRDLRFEQDDGGTIFVDILGPAERKKMISIQNLAKILKRFYLQEHPEELRKLEK